MRFFVKISPRSSLRTIGENGKFGSFCPKKPPPKTGDGIKQNNYGENQQVRGKNTKKIITNHPERLSRRNSRSQEYHRGRLLESWRVPKV